MGTVTTLSIGASTYSVYALTSDVMADTKTYFAAHISGSLWTAAGATTQKQSLVTAFRMLERLKWSGEKLVGSQPTKFPRTGLVCDGEAVPDGTPDDIALGEFELALLLIQDPALAGSRNTRSDVRRAKADVAEVEFFRAPAGEETPLPPSVMALISCFLSGTATDVGAPFVNGTDDESFFTADDQELTDGYA